MLPDTSLSPSHDPHIRHTLRPSNLSWQPSFSRTDQGLYGFAQLAQSLRILLYPTQHGLIVLSTLRNYSAQLVKATDVVIQVCTHRANLGDILGTPAVASARVSAVVYDDFVGPRRATD